jgi:predicted DNA binding CopG/RHH family protein
MLGDNRVRFVNLLFPGDTSLTSLVPAMELKNVSLQQISHYMCGSNPSSTQLEDLQQQLKGESEEELLERKFTFWEEKSKSHVTKRIKDLKLEAIRQIKGYLQILWKGNVFNTPRVIDQRINWPDRNDQLTGFVIVCVGGTRVLAWSV